MVFYDLEKVIKDEDGNYDFSISTFVFNNTIPIKTHIVTLDQEMRIDLVCKFLYGSSNNVDFIADLNNIILPLNIQEGDLILWVDSEFIKDFRPDDKIEILRDKLINVNKKQRIDKNRQTFLENGNVPISILTDDNVKAVKLDDDGNLIIGEGLFDA